jgi:hypothetical protein
VYAVVALQVLGFALAACLAVGVSVPARAAAGEPATVEVGVWLNGVHSIDFVDGSFGAEFYLWWISESADFRPFDVFQVLNGRQWTVRAINQRRLPDGRYHSSGYVSVTVSHDWKLLKYPFDEQKLEIALETPYTASEVRLVPDTAESRVSEFVRIKGYQVEQLSLSERVEEYETDFGYKDGAGSRFSRLMITLDLERRSGRLVLAILIGFIVANLIALLTFTIHVSMLGVRASMLTSAVFCAIGNMNLLNGQLNPAVGSLLVDRFALGSFAVIVVALANSIVVDRLAMHQRAALARTLNWSVFTVVLLASVAYYGLTLRAAMR